MVTLATQTIGGKTRRCDARCYTAKRDKCRCICGGKRHGVGLDRAVDTIREEAQALIRTEVIHGEANLVHTR